MTGNRQRYLVTAGVGILVAIGLAGSAASQSSTAARGAPAQNPANSETIANPPVTDDGTMTVPSFELPFSSFASREAAEESVRRLRKSGPVSVADMKATRELVNKSLEPSLDKMKALYPHTSTKSQIAGVPVETFVPAVGVAPENKDRVLIELHGGAGVAGGGGPGGAIESIPIASVGRIKVIAVDYRLMPENTWQAAVEDTIAVYREVLKTHKPENIGIFGCSAGGSLTARTMPWLIKAGLPLPGAIGVFCAGLMGRGGDSAQIWARMGSSGRSIVPARFDPNNPRLKDPLYTPSASAATLRAFPPTLILTGTRAPEMSSAAQSHLLLLEQGADSQLVLFDGLDHGFFSDPTFPESRSAYKIITDFFAKKLGKPLAAR